jgi:hypothetical protein
VLNSNPNIIEDGLQDKIKAVSDEIQYCNKSKIDSDGKSI